MCKKINQVEILQKKRARSAYSLRGIGIEDRRAIRGSVDRSIGELWMSHSLNKKRSGQKKNYWKFAENFSRLKRTVYTKREREWRKVRGYLLRVTTIHSLFQIIRWGDKRGYGKRGGKKVATHGTICL